jgi:hypothetical protein
MATYGDGFVLPVPKKNLNAMMQVVPNRFARSSYQWSLRKPLIER